MKPPLLAVSDWDNPVQSPVGNLAPSNIVPIAMLPSWEVPTAGCHCTLHESGLKEVKLAANDAARVPRHFVGDTGIAAESPLDAASTWKISLMYNLGSPLITLRFADDDVMYENAAGALRMRCLLGLRFW